MTFSPGTKPAKTAPKGRHLDINILTSLPCPNPRLRACLLPNPTESQRAQQPWSGMPRAQPRGREQSGEGGDRAGRACQHRRLWGTPYHADKMSSAWGDPECVWGQSLAQEVIMLFGNHRPAHVARTWGRGHTGACRWMGTDLKLPAKTAAARV